MAHEMMASPERAASNFGQIDQVALRQARVDLAACFRMAARLGFEEGICNHFSAMVPGRDELFLVNPYGLAFSEITASSLLVCDFDGHVIEGDGRPEATAFFIHGRLHQRLPRARAAFHTHMPNATALSMVEGEPLAWAGQTALKFYGRTAVDGAYNGLALDGAEGDRIAATLGNADIVFHAQPRRDGDGAHDRGSVGRSVLPRAGGGSAGQGAEHRAQALAGRPGGGAAHGRADARRGFGERAAASRKRQTDARTERAGVCCLKRLLHGSVERRSSAVSSDRYGRRHTSVVRVVASGSVR